MSLDTDFVSKLSSLTSCPVQQDTISEDKAEPYVSFYRYTTAYDYDLAGTIMLTHTSYMVEVAGLDVDNTNTAADTIKNSLNGSTGTMGATHTLSVEIEDANDEYIPKAMDYDAGFHVCSFQVKIIS